MSGVIKEAKYEAVLREFKAGTLHSSNGDKVTNPAQAKAIAHSEAGDPRRPARKKKKGGKMGKGGWIAKMLHRHFSKVS